MGKRYLIDESSTKHQFFKRRIVEILTYLNVFGKKKVSKKLNREGEPNSRGAARIQTGTLGALNSQIFDEGTMHLWIDPQYSHD